MVGKLVWELNMIKFLRRLRRSERAATAVEYGLILSLVVIACIGAFTRMAAATNGMWNNIATAVTAN
jgi:pilus assembly protein Flp/PilA